MSSRSTKLYFCSSVLNSDIVIVGLKVAVKTFPEGLVTGTIPHALGGPKTKQIIPAAQREFSMEDIDCIEMYLDNALQDHSVGSK